MHISVGSVHDLGISKLLTALCSQNRIITYLYLKCFVKYGVSSLLRILVKFFWISYLIHNCKKWPICSQGLEVMILAAAWDFQQCDILTSVDSDDPVQPPLKLRNSKWCSVSSLTVIEYSSDLQRLWSDCAYAQADLRLCWSHIPHCWKSHALAHFWVILCIGKCTMCFEMTKVRLFKDLKKIISKSSTKIWCFFYEPLWSNVSFFSLSIIFSKFLNGIEETAP